MRYLVFIKLTIISIAENIIQHCGVIVLAAGGSTRLGKPKQLLPYKGASLLQHAVTEAIGAALTPVIVVAGSNAELIKNELTSMPVELVDNANWQSGMASSIVTGLNFLLSRYPEVDGVIFLMSDQPFVNATLLHELLQVHRTTTKLMVASSYNGTVGVPVLFHHSIFPQLLQLTGDEGARKLLQRHIEQVATVSFPQGDIDIDTPGDYENLLRS